MHHNYYLADDEGGSISYYFVSTNGAVYTVSFEIEQYDQYVNDYNHLFNKGYGLNFIRMTSPVHKIKKDDLIFITIEMIVNDFIKQNGNDVVLLFHCAFGDGRQQYRDKLFMDKISKSLSRDNFKISRVEATIQETGIKHFMGYITPADNPNIAFVDLEFDACSFNLIQDKASSNI